MTRYRLKLSVAVLGIFILSFHYVYCAEPIWNEYLQMRLIVPEDFKESPDIAKQNHAEYVFVQQTQPAGELVTMFVIRKMGGIIGQEPLKSLSLPDGTPAKISILRWKSFDVQMVTIAKLANGINGVNLIAQLPIKREAVMVTVFGDARREAELKILLDIILANIDAPSNWPTPDVPIQKFNAPSIGTWRDEITEKRIYRSLEILLYLCLGIGPVWWILRSRKKKEKEKAQMEFRQKMAEDQPFE